MPLKKDASGRRAVEMNIEVPGTPEQVWQALATGPGNAAWFTACEIEEREGGAIAFHFGPDMASRGRVTTWQPPHRFCYEEIGWSGEAPPLATEIVIEAQAGGTCRVRMVHSLFTERDQWDDELGSMERGWPSYFEILKVYLRHFAGMRSSYLRVTGDHTGPAMAAWAALRQAVGFVDAAEGTHWQAKGTPPLAGAIERVNAQADHGEFLLRLDAPGPGVALVGAFTWGGRTQVAISFYFYGETEPATIAREEPAWQAWMREHFPAAAAA